VETVRFPDLKEMIFMEDLKSIVEALILVSDVPLSVEKISSVLQEVEKEHILSVLQELIREYEEKKGGFILQEVAGGYQYRTRADLSVWIKRLKGGKSALMSPAAMETLAIVAYRQPVVKAEIDKIRGVDAGGPLKKLLDKKMVRIVGRKDVPGKPILYGTTKKFLEVFNLKDLAELPTLQEMKELQDDLPTLQEVKEIQEELPMLQEMKDPREE
jgi:segregation and condensation protein B